MSCHHTDVVRQSEWDVSGVSLPVSRPIGRALIVANPAGRADVLSAMQRLGYGATELDDPYAAMAELCQRPLAYRAVVLSLAGLYREELNLMPAIKSRFPHIEIWLSHTDGRQGALADAMRLGADGLLAEDGLHRVAISGGGLTPPPLTTPAPPPRARIDVCRRRGDHHRRG